MNPTGFLGETPSNWNLFYPLPSPPLVAEAGRLLQRHQHGADRHVGGRDLRLHVAEAPRLLDPSGTHCGVQPAQVPGMMVGDGDGDGVGDGDGDGDGDDG